MRTIVPNVHAGARGGDSDADRAGFDWVRAGEKKNLSNHKGRNASNTIVLPQICMERVKNAVAQILVAAPSEVRSWYLGSQFGPESALLTDAVSSSTNYDSAPGQVRELMASYEFITKFMPNIKSMARSVVQRARLHEYIYPSLSAADGVCISNSCLSSE
jgi:hypothetical protein